MCKYLLIKLSFSKIFWRNNYELYTYNFIFLLWCSIYHLTHRGLSRLRIPQNTRLQHLRYQLLYFFTNYSLFGKILTQNHFGAHGLTSFKWLRLSCTATLEGIFQIYPFFTFTVCLTFSWNSHTFLCWRCWCPWKGLIAFFILECKMFYWHRNRSVKGGPCFPRWSSKCSLAGCFLSFFLFPFFLIYLFKKLE